VAFYISGHGFGHASRQIEIINALAARRPDIGIFIRSSAARRLFDRTIARPFDLDDRPNDTGVVQLDSLHLDAAATIAEAREFYRTLDGRAAAEAALLRDRDVRLVIADAPPLACEAAARAGIASIVVANFTWDWIYAEYAEQLDAAPDLIPIIESAYRKATAAWRLPMHGGFAAFQTIVDVPFVARHARRDRGRESVLGALGLPTDRPLALVSFGGYGVRDLPLGHLDCLQDWTIVLTGSEPDPGPASRVRIVEERELYEHGLRYEDLVAACDVVVTKPGYGIVSECIANDTALVYTSRGRFAEYPVLVQEMPKYLRCAYIDHASLLGGRWLAALNAAIGAPSPPERPRTDGADVIADMIAALVHSA
jgi:L-arabinokinase